MILAFPFRVQDLPYGRTCTPYNNMPTAERHRDSLASGKWRKYPPLTR